jgi:hypothetical protein
MLYDRASAAGCCRGERVAPQEGARERRHDERQRRQAQQQQRPVANPPAPHGLVGNPLQEHQRRKLDDVLPLALDQVNDHRHRQRREPEQEQRGQE